MVYFTVLEQLAWQVNAKQNNHKRKKQFVGFIIKPKKNSSSHFYQNTNLDLLKYSREKKLSGDLNSQKTHPFSSFLNIIKNIQLNKLKGIYFINRYLKASEICTLFTSEQLIFLHLQSLKPSYLFSFWPELKPSYLSTKPHHFHK